MNDTSEILTLHEPEGPAPRGTLIVVAGRGENPEVYRRFGTRLAFDAYRVHVIGDPADDPQGAAAQIAAVLANPDLPTPIVLVGSDTGALFAAALAAGGALAGLAGLVVAGLPVALDGLPPGDWEEELDARTTCPTHRGRISDEIVAPGALYAPVPDGWTRAVALEDITVPTLAIHGQEDPISPLEEARDALSALGELEFVTVAGARHDALNDRSHRTVAATVVMWLERLKLDPEMAPIATVDPRGADRV